MPNHDAGIGRFISADTIISDPFNPQLFNRYSYCLNNPLKYIDPTGHQEELTDEEALAIIAQYGLDLPSDSELGRLLDEWAKSKCASATAPNMPLEKGDEQSRDNTDWGKVIGGAALIVLTDLTLGTLTAVSIVFAPEALPVVIWIDECIGGPVNALGILLIYEGTGGWSITDWLKDTGNNIRNWLKVNGLY